MNEAITLSGLSFMIRPETRTPRIMPTTAPRPEKPSALGSLDINIFPITELVTVKTEVRMQVYKIVCLVTPALRMR